MISVGAFARSGRLRSPPADPPRVPDAAEAACCPAVPRHAPASAVHRAWPGPAAAKGPQDAGPDGPPGTFCARGRHHPRQPHLRAGCPVPRPTLRAQLWPPRRDQGRPAASEHAHGNVRTGLQLPLRGIRGPLLRHLRSQGWVRAQISWEHVLV
eukprot:scaffold5085_cov247-Pinguiococcus_pyrenoidosus.AAC.3